MMGYKGYHATIDYDAEDKIFVGKVFGITDSLNFHGTTVDELEEMFHQSIENYLDICSQCGKEPDKEFKGSFNVRVSPELHKKIAIMAAEQKITLNQYVAQALEKSFENLAVKETIIYMPQSNRTVSWENDDFMDLGAYIDSGTFNRKEKNFYVEH
ncbi:type II toxin-antitoxin system HicB family antitoxin [Aminipila butyrica]|uniref:Type II toxin-antitoxin system HicB family antitoxin n=2 Tax=Aminipila butyrica TaxID=433296 RepID=A0A858BZ80_9FIRM|nr:type II toxin-antitoxin system HicB family antitoxin [Aminipila butyrica]